MFSWQLLKRYTSIRNKPMFYVQSLNDNKLCESDEKEPPILIDGIKECFLC